MPDHPITSPDYADWLGEVKSRIQSARISAARAASRELILLYWDIGRGIVEKQKKLGWGKSVVEQLGGDLRAEYPGMRGFSADNLWRMRQVFSEYSNPAFLEQLVPELKSLWLPDGSDGVSSGSAILERFVQEVLSPVPWGHHVRDRQKSEGCPRTTLTN